MSDDIEHRLRDLLDQTLRRTVQTMPPETTVCRPSDRLWFVGHKAADEIERQRTILKQIAGDNHLTLTEHQLMAKWALEGTE